MNNDAPGERLADMVVRMQDQLADIASMQKQQAALQLDAQAAEGTVEVTVNAQGQVVKTVIDKSYLDEHEFEELGEHITKAAQAAARDAGRRVAEMLAPITERYKSFPSLSDIVDGLPDPSDLVPPELEAFVAGPRHREGPSASSTGAIYDNDGEGDAEFPAVRR